MLAERTADDGGAMVRFLENEEPWDGSLLRPADTFVTGIGSGTTYPDYKPAPLIVSSLFHGLDTVTVVTEGIFSYCGAKLKIDTDRHVGTRDCGCPRKRRAGRSRNDGGIRLGLGGPSRYRTRV